MNGIPHHLVALAGTLGSEGLATLFRRIHVWALTAGATLSWRPKKVSGNEKRGSEHS